MWSIYEASIMKNCVVQLIESEVVIEDLVMKSLPSDLTEDLASKPPRNSNKKWFDDLKSASASALKQLGLKKWGENKLWLFPKEWYKFIPKGYAVMDIFGDTENFSPGKTDDDSRFGCLAFGIVNNTAKY